MNTMLRRFAFLALIAPAFAQLSPSGTWAAHAVNEYQVMANITYLVANNYENKLDIYHRRDATTPQPTVIFIHGGGWVGGSKETSQMALMPWLEMGWNVVNIEYRLGRISLAPAAVEDCLCALRWVAAHAKEYHIDTGRLVVTGESAGGHLALTTGMIPESAGLDRECPGVPLPKVAAIVNWYGITDVVDLLDGANQKSYAVAWLGSMPNREEIARRVSPLTYVRSDLPPTLTIHGDADPTVPYTHALRLTEALSKADVPNQLLTIPGGHHGGFTPEERTRIFTTIRDFLAKYNLPVMATNPYPREKELALGRGLAADVERRYKVLDDPGVTDRVIGIAQNLAQHASLTFPVTVKVLDNSEVRASVLPGGFIYVTRALLSRYQTEPQLAAVLAHQIAHVAAQRPASIGPFLMGGPLGICTRYADGPVPQAWRAQAQSNEVEADALARDYLRDAGYPLTPGV